ncbi:MAG: biosis protein MshJ [Burkholderiaceae bacterium]|nr:biosis protein MshJ [Burkholderiaceae bacterium]
MILQYWQKLSLRLDAMNLRERALVFAAAALALIFLLNELMLDPLFVQQKRLAQQISQDQAKAAEMQREIQQKILANAQDPDKLNQKKLQEVREQIQTLRTDLLGVQKNLVSPEKMPQLLEDLLRRNGRLKLVSLKTLPPQNLNAPEKKDAKEADAGAPKAQAAAAQPPGAKPEAEAGAIYRHGVEIVVQGKYQDMVDYLTALEGMKWELYWGKAKLQVDEYPVVNLTLTVYTLSLDKTWLNL